MEVVHIAPRVNIRRITNVKVVGMEEYIIWHWLDVYAIKLLTCSGMVKLVFCVNIPNIGILVIFNAKYAHSNKSMIFSIGNANTVLHQIHISMDYTAQFVRIINIIILPLIPVCHVQVAEYIIQFKWYANVHRIIHFRLPVDVYNVICLTILIKHHKHVCRALKITYLTQV